VFKRTLNLEINQAYGDLKKSLFQKNCKIVSENFPTQLLVRQGSLWGISPSSAKKTIHFELVSAESKTDVTCKSRLNSDWRNVTIIGCILAAVLAGVCLWMAFDLTAVVGSGKATFWRWLVTSHGTVDVSVAKAFVNLTEDLAAFLFLIIVFEVAVAIYAQKKIDRFAQGILESLGGARVTQGKKEQIA